MIIEKCLMGICIELAPIDASAPKFFGFSEFLTSLALMVLAWTTSDVRYRFRIECAPIPLKRFTFWVVAIVGALTLLTDLWRAEQRLFPTSISLTFWQAIMGGALLMTFLFWAWFAFVRTAVYGKWNAERFKNELERHIINGSGKDLAIIADELSSSIHNIIKYATNNPLEPTRQDAKNPKVSKNSNDILMLIADKNFCREIIEHSQKTVYCIVKEISETKKYHAIAIFTKNIVLEAINNKNSFIYKEIDVLDSGYIGSRKPISNLLFSNYDMTKIGTTLLLEIPSEPRWGNDQWKAYCRIVLMTLKSYDPEKHGIESPVLRSALRGIMQEVNAINITNEIKGHIFSREHSDIIQIITKFVNDSINHFDKAPISSKTNLSSHEISKHPEGTIYDNISCLMNSIAICISNIEHPVLKTDLELYMIICTSFFLTPRKRTSGTIVRKKFRGLIFSTIKTLRTQPSDQAAMMLGLILNSMAISKGEDKYLGQETAIFDLTSRWLKYNYDWLYENHRNIAELCLGDYSIYQSEEHRIVIKHFSSSKQGRKHEHLDIYPAVPSLASSSPTPTEH